MNALIISQVINLTKKLFLSNPKKENAVRLLDTVLRTKGLTRAHACGKGLSDVLTCPCNEWCCNETKGKTEKRTMGKYRNTESKEKALYFLSFFLYWIKFHFVFSSSAFFFCTTIDAIIMMRYSKIDSLIEYQFKCL